MLRITACLKKPMEKKLIILSIDQREADLVKVYCCVTNHAKLSDISYWRHWFLDVSPVNKLCIENNKIQRLESSVVLITHIPILTPYAECLAGSVIHRTMSSLSIWYRYVCVCAQACVHVCMCVCFACSNVYIHTCLCKHMWKSQVGNWMSPSRKGI